MLNENQITATINGTTETAITDNRDWVAYDLTRPKRQWPSFEDAPFVGTTFLAWSALRRAGKTQLKLDEFLEQATDVTMGEAVEIDPTQPAPEAG